MQAFTDLVGTATLPAHAFDIAELTELTPALDIATSDIHGKVEEASAAATTYTATFPFCYGCVG